jgi:hypothetical protein
MLVFGVVAVAVALAVFEYYFGWPDWLTVNSNRGRFPKL